MKTPDWLGCVLFGYVVGFGGRITIVKQILKYTWKDKGTRIAKIIWKQKYKIWNSYYPVPSLTIK